MARSASCGRNGGKAKAAIANRDRRHAMPAANGAVRIPVQLGVIVGVKIDESWGHDEPAGIDHFRGVAAGQPADFGDLAVLDADVALVARDSRPINDRPAFNNGIELRHKALLDKNFPMESI
jgi:hypothetical protein